MVPCWSAAYDRRHRDLTEGSARHEELDTAKNGRTRRSYLMRAPGGLSARDTIRALTRSERDTVAINLNLAAPPSDDDILVLSSRNPGFKFERSAAGELIVTPGSSATGRREAVLVAQLGRWAEVQGRGVVFGPSAGFRLPDGSLFSPDAAWMPEERWTALTPEQRDSFAPLCPDVVFEVASKSDTQNALRTKMLAYLANGARLAVLIDPQRRAVEIYEAGADPRILEHVASVSLDPALAGFTLYLGSIFS